MVFFARRYAEAIDSLKATLELGGSCAGAFLPGGPTIPAGLSNLLDACCDADSVCTGATVPGFSVDTCITQVDAFNSTESNTVTFPFDPGPADSSVCRASKGNGVVVSPGP